MKSFPSSSQFIFNEFNLPDSIPQLLALAEKLPAYQLELVFVDDGSGDGSLDVLLEHQEKYPQSIKVVKLTRNFGSMAAIQEPVSVWRQVTAWA